MSCVRPMNLQRRAESALISQIYEKLYYKHLKPLNNSKKWATQESIIQIPDPAWLEQTAPSLAQLLKISISFTHSKCPSKLFNRDVLFCSEKRHKLHWRYSACFSALKGEASCLLVLSESQILPSPGLLRGVRWFEADVSGLQKGPIHHDGLFNCHRTVTHTHTHTRIAAFITVTV
jgi:hypothetical protein